MRTRILLCLLLDFCCQPVFAQRNPFIQTTAEYKIYQLYLDEEVYHSHHLFPEVASLYDERPRHTLVLQLLYNYFLSIAFFYDDQRVEAIETALKCRQLFNYHDSKKNKFWDEEDTWYLQGMDRIYTKKLKAWISYLLDPQTNQSPKSMSIQPELTIPEFPFPPPQSSTRKVIDRHIFASCATLKDVSILIGEALDQCGYERSFYSIPNGFAVVARIEQFDARTAASILPPDRWSVDFPPLRDFGDYLKTLVFGRIGHFRIVAFLVTNQPFYERKTLVGFQDGISWVNGGFNVLPDDFAKINWTSNYECTALIYEFEVTTTRLKGDLVLSKLNAQTHLEQSYILPALRQTRLR